MLAHGDLSQWNIFVDEEDKPVAVLDWENIKIAPLLFLTKPPGFIDSAEDFHEPEHIKVENLETFNPEERAKYIKDNEDWYAEHLNDYQCTMLRQIYVERLKSLGSRLARAAAENLPDFDRELADHIIYFSWQAEDCAEWVGAQLSEDTEVLGSESSLEDDGQSEQEVWSVYYNPNS